MDIEAHLVPLVDEGLGNSAYLLDVGDGRALAVDPPRDLRALRQAADRRGLRVVWAADTHLHADFLTGAVQLAATESATILASAAGMRALCGHGERAMTAATLLQRAGHGAVSVLDGGAHDWAKATGNALEQP